MTHDPTTHGEATAMTTDATAAASHLARHAAARIWRHLADDPDTDPAVRQTLLYHLPAIEADPVGANWRTISNDALYNNAATIRTIRTVRGAYDASSVAYDAYATGEADYATGDADYATANATANAKRAVELGCAGTGRIGLALRFLAEFADDDYCSYDPSAAWDLSGEVAI